MALKSAAHILDRGDPLRSSACSSATRSRSGITPTGWTNDDFRRSATSIPFEQCVSEMALAGFEGCSVGHKYPTDAGELRAALELRGLRVSEPWASTYFTVNGMERADARAASSSQMAFIKDDGRHRHRARRARPRRAPAAGRAQAEQAGLRRRAVEGADRRASTGSAQMRGRRRHAPLLPPPHGHRRADPRGGRPADGRHRPGARPPAASTPATSTGPATTRSSWRGPTPSASSTCT